MITYYRYERERLECFSLLFFYRKFFEERR